MTKKQSRALSVFLFIVGSYFFIKGVAAGQAFLAPLVTAVILALIVLPLSRKMEGKFIGRSFSSLVSTILIFVFSLLFFALCSLQIKNFINDWASIKKTMAPEVEEFKTFLFEHTPMSKESLESTYPEGSIPFLDNPLNQGARALSFVRQVMNFMGVYLLTFIYIFFILNYRQHFKKFLLRLFPDRKKHHVEHILDKSAQVVQDYLSGRLILMAILAVLYAVGLGWSGVENYILIAIIASLLTLIPWIGNIIGLAMAMAFGYLTSGDLSVLWGIILTFTISQFVESYILQPYIVGDKVGLHPFFVIVFVILGGAIWGLMGMVLAIPVMAVVTIVFQNIDPLNPYGFLFGKETEE